MPIDLGHPKEQHPDREVRLFSNAGRYKVSMAEHSIQSMHLVHSGLGNDRRHPNVPETCHLPRGDAVVILLPRQETILSLVWSDMNRSEDLSPSHYIADLAHLPSDRRHTGINSSRATSTLVLHKLYRFRHIDYIYTVRQQHQIGCEPKHQLMLHAHLEHVPCEQLLEGLGIRMVEEVADDSRDYDEWYRKNHTRYTLRD